MAVFSSSVNFLEGIYIIFLAVGFILSLFSLGFGGHGGHMSHVGNAHLGHNYSIGHSSNTGMHQTGNTNNSVYTVSILNIQAVFAFLLGFGAGGLIGFQVFHIDLLTLPFALAGGVLFWWVVRAILKVMLKNQTAFLDLKDADAVGVTAIVTTRISKDSIGEVIYPLQGTNRISRAKALDGGQINKGENVVIVKVERGVAYVMLVDTFESKY